MAEPTLIVQGFVNPVGLRVLADTNQVIVAQRNGRLFAVDLTTNVRSSAGGAPGRVEAFAVTADGQTAYVAGDLIGVWSVGLNGGPRRRLVRGLQNPRGVLVDSDGVVQVAEGRSPGRLVSINPDPVSAVIKARGLRNARGIMQEPTGRVLAVEAGNGGRIVAPDPGGPPTVVVGGLGTPVDIAPLENERVVVCDRAGKRVLLVDLSLPGNAPAELFTNIDNLWAAEPFGADRLIIGAGDALLLGQLATEAAQDPVEVRLLGGELFIGGWVRARVIINDPAIAFDDLEFDIKPEEAAAMVSLSRDNSFDPVKPH